VALLLDGSLIGVGGAQAYYQRFIHPLSMGLGEDGRALALITAPSLEGSIQTALDQGHAALVCARAFTAKACELCEERPLVFLNRPSPLPARYPSVMPDNHGGLFAAVRRLHHLGHRRIAFFGMTPLSVHSEARLAGYRAALKALGLPESEALIKTPPRVEGSFEEVSALAGECLEAWLRLPRPPTACVTMGDVYALPLLAHARARGLELPGRFSVIGFDDTNACLSSVPLLSSIDAQMETLALEAVSLVRLALGRGVEPPRRVVVPAVLRERASIGDCA